MKFITLLLCLFLLGCSTIELEIEFEDEMKLEEFIKTGGQDETF